MNPSPNGWLMQVSVHRWHVIMLLCGSNPPVLCGDGISWVEILARQVTYIVTRYSNQALMRLFTFGGCNSSASS